MQVGGRGKAGGIKLADDPAGAKAVAEQILGMDIKGHKVRRVLVEQAGDIKSEFYASFLLDRTAKAYLGMMSAKGGVDIEEVAATDPEAIARVHVSPLTGLQPYHVRELLFGAQIPKEAHAGASELLEKIYRVLRRDGRLSGRGEPDGSDGGRQRRSPSTPRCRSMRTPAIATQSSRSSRRRSRSRSRRRLRRRRASTT